MPSREQHTKQYLRNKKMASIPELSLDDNYDWKITMLFYAGLHCIETTIADREYHPSTHTARKNFLERNISVYGSILDDYENLEMLSRNSRYKCIKMKKKRFQDALGNIEEIEKFVDKIS